MSRRCNGSDIGRGASVLGERRRACGRHGPRQVLWPVQTAVELRVEWGLARSARGTVLQLTKLHGEVVLQLVGLARLAPAQDHRYDHAQQHHPGARAAAGQKGQVALVLVTEIFVAAVRQSVAHQRPVDAVLPRFCAASRLRVHAVLTFGAGVFLAGIHWLKSNSRPNQLETYDLSWLSNGRLYRRM